MSHEGMPTYVRLGSVYVRPFLWSLMFLLCTATQAQAQAAAERLIDQRHWTFILVGGLVVFFFALSRFNVPEPPEARRGEHNRRPERFTLTVNNRSTTTAFRYHSAALSYAGVATVLYGTLVYSPKASLVFNLLSEASATNLADTATPLTLALFLVGATKLGPVKRVDAFLRGQLRYMAAIPDEVRRLSKSLRQSDDPEDATATFTADEEMCKRLYKRFQADALPRNAIAFVPNGKGPYIGYLWTKVELMMEHLARWNEDSELSVHRFMVGQAEAYEALLERRNNLSNRIRVCLSYLEVSPPQDAGIVTVYEKDLEHDTKALLRDVYDFVSAGVLVLEPRLSGIHRRLTQLGFTVEYRPLPISWHDLVGLGVGVWLVTLGGFLALASPANVMPIRKIFTLSSYIGLAAVVASLAAIYPRHRRWAIARPSEGRRPLWGHYFAAGGLAYLVQAPFAFGYVALTAGSGVRAQGVAGLWRVFWDRQVCGWLWLPFALAAVLAALVDLNIGEKLAKGTRRGWVVAALEGVIAGLVTMSTGAAVMLAHGKNPLKALPVLFLFGVVPGAIIPSLWRTTPPNREAALKLVDIAVRKDDEVRATP